ncbi:MAG: hypothetical protein M1333_01925 [Patescibacteria group bacterium]|nr:hypothetical protein [Patescibacteria group bacterium]
MPEVLTMPETRNVKEEIGYVSRLFEEVLDPNGPFRWDLPPKLLLPGDEDYKLFVCRSNVYLERLVPLNYLIKIGALPLPQENAVSDAMANLQAISRRPGLRTPEDMEEIRHELNQVVTALRISRQEAAA